MKALDYLHFRGIIQVGLTETVVTYTVRDLMKALDYLHFRGIIQVGLTEPAIICVLRDVLKALKKHT